MKTLKHLLFLCFLAVLTACSEDALVPQSEVVPTAEGGSVDYISMTVPDIEIDDAATRSKLIDDGTELKFLWQENDAIGVVPMNGLPLKFPIHAENAQKNTAVFDGGDWALKTDTKYAAFFPFKKKNYEKDITSIAIDYTGQTQANWMKYDFLATGAVKPKDGAVKFTMKRLSAILKIQVEFDASNISTIRYATLIAPEPLFGVKGTLDLSGSEPVYTPEGLTKFINTDIGVDKSLSSSSGTIVFTFYFMIPPTDLRGKQVKLLTNSDLGTAKEAFFDGQNYEAGKAYSINISSSGSAYIRNANLIKAAGLGDGSTSINAWSNREQILQVKNIDVSDLDDPTVCDEIGFFRNLEVLYCSTNRLTSLDVSNCPALTNLYCFSNLLTSLDVSNNPALTELTCSSNLLTSLDVSNNPALTELACNSNQLTFVDVSNNPALGYLNCSDNRFTSLDLSNNLALTDLDCNSNLLTSLEISNNPALGYLNCSDNRFTSLDISNNMELESVYCVGNQLTSLDVSNNKALRILRCQGNLLDSLIITNHPSLESLHVGNAGLKKLDCHANALTRLSLYNSSSITDLNCSYNALTTLNIGSCSDLTKLRCSDNYLTSLNLSNKTSLDELWCHRNLMSSLDITTCTALRKTMVFCGSQYTNKNKIEDRALTLYARASDTTSLRFPGNHNLNVTVVNQ